VQRDWPVLIADVGGTRLRFAILAGSDGPMHVLPCMETRDHASLLQAIRALNLSDSSLPEPRWAVIALAAPIDGDSLAMTNLNWNISPQQLLQELGLEAIVILNDFEAIALALPALEPDHLEQIGSGTPDISSPMVAFGPGTGLGVSGVIPSSNCWIPLASQGGHVSLGPHTKQEWKIWPHLTDMDQTSGIEAEDLLCGRGLVRLANAVAASMNRPVHFTVPEDIAISAKSGEEISSCTVRIFTELLGRLASDIALTLLARGGLYLTGGVVTKLDRFLFDGSFRRSFENKPVHRDLISRIPTFLIRHELPALYGIQSYLRNPEAYRVELQNRTWRVLTLS